MIGGLGMPELIIIMVIVMILFGGRKLPEIGAGLGKAISGFRKASEEPVEILHDVASEVTAEIASIEDKNLKTSTAD